jgi:hypothetical protein
VKDGGVTMGHDDKKTVMGQNHNFYSKIRAFLYKARTVLLKIYFFKACYKREAYRINICFYLIFYIKTRRGTVRAFLINSPK